MRAFVFLANVYAGTANWAGEYFGNTAGSAMGVNQTSAQSADLTVQQQLQAVFERDWDSSYSTRLNHNTNVKDVCRVPPSQQEEL